MRNREEIKSDLECRLKQEAKYEMIDGRICFRTNDGGFLRLDTIGEPSNCIVIEYAYNRAEANNNVFEDGDLLYVEEMTDEKMMDQIRKEINE